MRAMKSRAGAMGGGMANMAPAPMMAAPAPVMAEAAMYKCESFASPPSAPANQNPQQQPPPQRQGSPVPSSGVSAGTRDYTQVPRQMDEQFEKFDSDSALRPTIINAAPTWTKKAQKALLATQSSTVLGAKEQKTEKDAAFDLLDALTKSGALPLTHSSLHVIVAATHCFDESVTETIVKENVNPIEKVERSTLIMASTIHEQPVAALIQEGQYTRVKDVSPVFFLEDCQL